MLPDQPASAPYQVLPDLTDDEFAALKADIAEPGIVVPVELDEHGRILDGHHRARASTELRAEWYAVSDYPRIVRVGPSEDQERACPDWAALGASQAALRHDHRRRPSRLDGGSVVIRTERR